DDGAVARDAPFVDRRPQRVVHLGDEDPLPVSRTLEVEGVLGQVLDESPEPALADHPFAVHGRRLSSRRAGPARPRRATSDGRQATETDPSPVWTRHSAAYRPPVSTSSSWVPCST